jgi:sugar phosphate isomerase/epimerase
MRYPSVLVSSTLFWALPPEKWFRYAWEYGLAGIEIWAQQLENNAIRAEAVKRLARRYGAELTVHSYSWGLNLLSLNEGTRDVAMELAKKAIRLASFLDAKQVTIHPGRKVFHMPGLHYDRLLTQSATALADYAVEWGTMASFEIMEKLPKELLTSTDAVRRMEMMAQSRIGWKYTIDLAHCDSVDEIETMALLLNNRIGEFHVSNKKGKKRHVTDIASGDFDLPLLIAALDQYGLPYILEGRDLSTDAEVFKNIMTYLGMGGEQRNEIEKNRSALGRLRCSDYHLSRFATALATRTAPDLD